MRRLATYAATVAISAAVVYSVLTLDASADPIPPVTTATPETPEVKRENVKVGGRDVFRWRKIALQRDRTARMQAKTIKRLRRTLQHRGTVTEAINPTAITYGVSGSTLFRKASCESGLSPFAKNSSSTASGLFQFLTSTWQTTPFRRMSIWSPYANAMAAGWMHRNGRGGEWVCQ